MGGGEDKGRNNPEPGTFLIYTGDPLECPHLYLFQEYEGVQVRPLRDVTLPCGAAVKIDGEQVVLAKQGYLTCQAGQCVLSLFFEMVNRFHGAASVRDGGNKCRT